MYKEQTVAVVIPAYNEAEFVATVIETVPDFVDRIYAIDDYSTDETWAEIRRSARQINEPIEPPPVLSSDRESFSRRVVPIKHEKNRGVGGAIKTGYRRALDDGIDVVAVMNGDGQMDPDILDRIIDPIVTGQVEYTKGNRLLFPRYREDMPTGRFIGNVILSVLTKAASGYWKTSDSQNGYTAISARALDALPIDELYDEYGFLNHVLFHLNLRKFRVTDVAMAASYGTETSHIRYSTFVPKLSILLVRCFLARLKIKFLVVDFHPLVALYVVGMIGIANGVFGAIAMGLRGSFDAVFGAVLLLVFLVGAISLTLATTFDMQQSEHLERQHYGLVPDEEIEPALEHPASTDDQTRSSRQ